MKKKKISFIVLTAIILSFATPNSTFAEPYDYKEGVDNNAFEDTRNNQTRTYRSWGQDGNNFFWKEYNTHHSVTPTHLTDAEGWITIEYSERGPETMEETIPGIVFPVDNEYNGDFFIGKEVHEITKEPMPENPDDEHSGEEPETPSLWPYEDFDYPDDASLIEMMMYYINQGDWRDFYMDHSGETFAKSGCLASSVAMILSHYLGYQVKPTELNQYINSKAQLDCATALAAYGFGYRNVTTNVMQNTINNLRDGKPCIMHIRGQWGKYHTTDNGHFLVAYGYDNGGIYVMDPGKRANHYIPYEDWGHVNDLYLREVYRL